MKRDVRFGRVLLISVAIVAFLAYMDTQGYAMWQLIGGLGSETYGNLEPHYMKMFWGFAYAMIGVVSLTYYFITQDKSESVALFVVPSLLVAGGWEDIIYYKLGGFEFAGQVMPWLNGKWLMGSVANFMGSADVTSKTLMVSGGVSIILAYGAYKWLKEM